MKLNVKFNLRPWRQAQKEQRKKGFIVTTVIVILVMIFLLGGNYFIENNYIDSQSQAIDSLQTHIEPLKKAKIEVDKITKMNQELNKQIDVIRGLEDYRQKIIAVLDNISLAVPDTVFLNSLKIDHDLITINGVAKTEKNVADFMRNLENIKNLESPILKSIETAKSTDRYVVPNETSVKSFSVTVAFKKLKKEP